MPRVIQWQMERGKAGTPNTSRWSRYCKLVWLHVFVYTQRIHQNLRMPKDEVSLVECTQNTQGPSALRSPKVQEVYTTFKKNGKAFEFASRPFAAFSDLSSGCYENMTKSTGNPAEGPPTYQVLMVNATRAGSVCESVCIATYTALYS